MPETAIITALGQMGAAGILGIAVVSLFNRLTETQAQFRQYLINQNAMLQEQNKMLLLAVSQAIPGFAEKYPNGNYGVKTNLMET